MQYGSMSTIFYASICSFPLKKSRAYISARNFWVHTTFLLIVFRFSNTFLASYITSLGSDEQTPQINPGYHQFNSTVGQNVTRNPQKDVYQHYVLMPSHVITCIRARSEPMPYWFVLYMYLLNKALNFSNILILSFSIVTHIISTGFHLIGITSTWYVKLLYFIMYFINYHFVCIPNYFIYYLESVQLLLLD